MKKVAVGAAIFSLVISGAVAAAPLASPEAAGASTNPPATHTVSIEAAEATFASKQFPTSPQDSKSYLLASRGSYVTYLKFDTSVLGPASIVSASIDLDVSGTTSSSGGVVVYPASSDWSASTLTYRNRPQHQSVAVTSSPVSTVAATIVSVPIVDASTVSVTSPTSFEVRHSQRGASTTFSKDATLTVVIAGEAPSTDGAPSIEEVPDVDATPPIPDAEQVTAPPPVEPAPAPAPANEPAPDLEGTPEPATITTEGMSFAVAGANTSPKKVFAHYFPPYPVSFDNLDPDVDYYARNYLNPVGEGGKHAEYGGLLRDRPEGRSSLSGDWKEQDFLDEVNDAADAGVDGFTIDIMTTSGQNWDRTLGLMDAAASADRDFSIVPNLDASASVRSAAPADIAAKLALLYASPAAHRLSTGEYLLSSFLAESQTTAWWSEIISRLKNTHGITVKFIAVMNNASDANLERFAPISYAMSVWGARTPLTVASAPNRAAKAHALGVKWMAPVAVQDMRPRTGVYAEAGNTETLRASWGRAISDGADMVQVVTWNDYSETTSFAPSEAHGEAFLDLSAYFATQFKSSAAPAITADSLYLTHRAHPYAAVPTTAMRLLSPTLDGPMAPRDTVEVVTLLTAPARLTVNVGGTRHTFDAPAGLGAMAFPLAVGTVSASAVRGSSTILSVSSPFRVVATPEMQDLQYYAVSSRVG